MKLHTVDVQFASPKSYAPLTKIPNLRTVIGTPDAATSTALRARGVKVKRRAG